MNESKSAGGVVINKNGLVLVTSQGGVVWSLPKGHIDDGEDEIEAAKREIHEETGVSDLLLVRKLGSYQRFKIGKDGIGENKNEHKTISMYLFKSNQIELKPVDDYHPEARWVDIDEAGKMLTHPKDKEFFVNNIDAVRKAAAEKLY